MRKFSGCQLLVAGLHRQQIEKKAFDWSRLIPWIPGINDIRRRGTRSDVASPNPGGAVAATHPHRKAVRSQIAKIDAPAIAAQKAKDLEYALGKRKANVAASAQAGSKRLRKK